MRKRIDFFERQKPHSKIKSDIVSEYFGAWVDIVKRNCRNLTYLDLFSGQGYYEDGNPSTPIKVFNVIEKKHIHRIVQPYFYEKESGLRKKLKKALSEHNVYGKLLHKPVFPDKEISRDIIPELPIKECTLSFVDPHGYQITADLLAALIGDWGSDCIFYLSTQGIRRNIETPSQEIDLIGLFGVEGLNKLREQFKSIQSWYVKDRLIIKQVAKRVMEIHGGKLYFQDFGMEFEKAKLVSYYLVLVSSHHRGFALMKEIMAKHSYKDSDGIPLYVYSESKLERDDQMHLHFGERMNQLKSNLLNDFKDKSMQVRKVLDDCHISKYIHTKNNIKDALIELEREKKVKIIPPSEQRPWRYGKPTLADDKVVYF